MARILVAEDAQYVQYLFGKVLKKEGHQVESSRDGIETLQKIHSDPIELLILDLNLPGVDGIQVIKKAHESWPKLPFITISGDVNPEKEEQLLKLGAARILRKPVSNEDLIKSVNSTLHPSRRILFIPNQTEPYKEFIKKTP